MESIQDTARAYFLVKLINGAIPELRNGIRCFEVELDGIRYLLTEEGGFIPLPLCDEPAPGWPQADS